MTTHPASPPNSVTGAASGYGLLWTALFAFPMMAAVQLMCSRLGMITGRGPVDASTVVSATVKLSNTIGTSTTASCQLQ